MRLSLALLFLVSASTSAQTVTTIAGNFPGGYSGDGGPATAAFLSDPIGLRMDAAGNLYIADNTNWVIRRIDTDGVITTIAGNGVSAFSGDGGPATAASLGSPVGIHVEPNGDVLIADSSNNRVRRVDADSGIIVTIAGTGGLGFSGDGGPATNAKVNSPNGVAVGVDGNVYIADTLNLRLRRVDATTGIISTVCGTGFPTSTGDGGPAIFATLTSPRRVTVDYLGNIYVLDRTANSRIRRIDAETGIITTVAGGGTLPAGNGPATQMNFGLLHDVAFYQDDLIVVGFAQAWKIEDGMATVVAGTGVAGNSGDGGDPLLATFGGHMQGVCVDADGAIFLSDTGNDTIRRIEPVPPEPQFVTTIAGTGVAGYSGNGGPATAAKLNAPRGIDTDGQGRLYVADSENFVVRRIAPNGVITTIAGNGVQGSGGDGGFATNASLGAPMGIDADSDGNVFIADQSNHCIRRVSALLGIIQTVAGTGVPGFSGDGGPGTAAQLSSPQGVTIDADGNVFIADTNNNRIRRVDFTTGVITTVCGTGSSGPSGDGGPATLAQLVSPEDVAVDDAGNIFIAEAVSPGLVRRIDADTGIIDTVVGGGIFGLTGLDSGPATSLYFDHVTAIAVDGDGHLLMAENERVWSVEFGLAKHIAGTGTFGYSGDGGDPVLATFGGITGLCVNAAGEVLVSDSDNDRIRKIGEPSPWSNVGTGLAGVTGVPTLVGSGTLEPSAPGSLSLTDAAPSAPCVLFVALASVPVPFKGGVLVAFPYSLQILLATNGGGSLLLPFAWPPTIPSGFPVYFQVAIKDLTADFGVSMSNGLRGVAP